MDGGLGEMEYEGELPERVNWIEHNHHITRTRTFCYAESNDPLRDFSCLCHSCDCRLYNPTGCTGITAAPTTGSETGSTSTPAASGTLVVSPTDAVPDFNMVLVDVSEKDYLGNIPVIFQGGMGQIHVKKIDVTLYRSDGQVKSMTLGIKKGDQVELEGTKQTDRVVVYVSMDNGDRYKINDVLSPYRTRK